MRESSSISPIWSSELMIWDKHFRGSLRERQRRVLHIASIEATQLLRSNWLLHYVWTTSGCCTHGVALLLTYVGADCCGLEGSYFACALSSAPLYSKSWGSSAPSYLKSFCDQYLLRTFCHTKIKLVVIIMQKETLRCYPRNDQWVSLLYCFNMAHMAPFQMTRALKDYCVLKSYIKPARSF